MKCDGCFREVSIYYVSDGKKYCEVCYVPETPSRSFDRLYQFVDYNTTGKPVEIRSKSQWQKHLKKHGLHDDIKQSVRKQSEYFDTDKYFAKQRDKKRSEMKDILRETFKR